MTQAQVLVTDGETRAVIAAVRGLAAAGFDVTVTASRPSLATAAWSRSAAHRIATPDPLTEPDRFVDALERVLAAGGFDVLMPGCDASLLDISAARERLEPHVRIGLPSDARVQRALDKSELAAAAARHGLESPPTTVCRSQEEAVDAARRIGFPVVVKPVSSVIDAPPARRRSHSLVAADEAALRQILSDFGDSLVQQHSDGALISFAGVLAGDQLLAEAVSRYHRTWPPDAGSACYSETIDAPETLRSSVVALLADLGWEGLFELELIQARAGGWHAIDLNPRPYGSMAVAIDAGANLPGVWCRHLTGAAPSPQRATAGVFYRWTDADLRHGLRRLRSGDASAAQALQIRRGTVHPYGRLNDPGPTVARVIEMAGAAQARRRGARTPGQKAPVVVIGAGPNGLAAVAHLRHAGLDVRCFGETLESWTRQMPGGMRLRSRRRSSHIADPTRSLTIDAFEQSEDRTVAHPNLGLDEFVDYGRWFQSRAVPDLDSRRVSEVAPDNGGFRVRLLGGEELNASRVVVAAGLGPFASRPAPFRELSPSVCSHAYAHADLAGFSGRRVAVIGSGQSALECAALLHERGASVEVLARTDAIHWLGADEEMQPAASARRRPSLSLSPPPTDVGGRLTGWIAAAPDVFRRVPSRFAPELSFRCIRPAGAAWLRPRLADVPLTCGVEVVGAGERDGEVDLKLSDGGTRAVDHVLLGTGYEVDVTRYPFMTPELSARLELADGSPVLGPGLESSVAGLHFMGAPAAHSFGPIMRFVVGTWYSAPAVARRAAGRRQPPISFAF